MIKKLKMRLGKGKLEHPKPWRPVAPLDVVKRVECLPCPFCWSKMVESKSLDGLRMWSHPAIECWCMAVTVYEGTIGISLWNQRGMSIDHKEITALIERINDEFEDKTDTIPVKIAYESWDKNDFEITCFGITIWSCLDKQHLEAGKVISDYIRDTVQTLAVNIGKVKVPR